MSIDRSPEKPYDFVPLPEGCARAACAGHHYFAQGLETGNLECDLVLLRPVQVAAGLLDFVDGNRSGEQLASLHATIAREGRRLYVLPGSSLKGTLRSLAEAVSCSCFSVVSGKVLNYIPAPLRRCTRVDELCPACRLFGMTGARRQNYMGSVHVADLVLPPDARAVLTRTPLLWTPARSRHGLPNRYLQGRHVRGRKFYYHGRVAAGPDARVALQAGQTLRATIYFDNLGPALLGVLLTALGLNPKYPFPIKVGAGKPVGMGSVEVRLLAAALRGAVAQGGRLGLGERSLVGDALREWVGECCRAAAKEGLLYPEGLERVAAILGRGGLETRHMPSGPY